MHDGAHTQRTVSTYIGLMQDEFLQEVSLSLICLLYLYLLIGYTDVLMKRLRMQA